MQQTKISEILQHKIPLNSQVMVNAWIRTRRDSKAGISFLNLHDGSAFNGLQVVVPNTLENYDHEVLRLSAGCSVSVTGTLVLSQNKKDFEIQASQLKVFGFVDNPDSYPIQPKPHTMEYLRTVPHLRPRTNIIGAMTRVRNCLAQAVHRFMHQEGFYWIQTPIITASDCEGAGEMFRVSTLDLANIPKNSDGKIDFTQDFFGKETFLTVSGQLNVEAYCLALSRVYTFGPTFRAENSNTSRHLAEFWMIEPEIAFANLMDNASLAEKMLKYVFSAVLEECEDDIAFFNQRVDQSCLQRLTDLIQQPFTLMDYSEGVKILENTSHKFEYPIAWGIDLQSEHERYLAEKHVQGPIVLMNYPKEIKSFYMRLNDDNKTVAAMDVLAPGIGEIIGGSQREERLEILDKRMDEIQLNKEDYYWYRDLRRYGTVPHSGFGLGFERLVSYVTGINNVRDVIAFPRTPKHCDQ